MNLLLRRIDLLAAANVQSVRLDEIQTQLVVDHLNQQGAARAVAELHGLVEPTVESGLVAGFQSAPVKSERAMSAPAPTPDPVAEEPGYLTTINGVKVYARASARPA